MITKHSGVEPPPLEPVTSHIRENGEEYHPPKKEPADPVVEPTKKAPSRYYGRVRIDAQRVNREIGVIVEEVIERLTGQMGCQVEITLEINARLPDGFDESTVRTISENSRTLKFEHYGFEEG